MAWQKVGPIRSRYSSLIPFLDVLHHKLDQVHHSHSISQIFHGKVIDPTVPEGYKLVEHVGFNAEHVDEEGLAHASYVLEEDALSGGHDDAFLCWFETTIQPLKISTVIHASPFHR